MATKPNILFILIDDLGWRDVSCCGSDFYETPNIDRLADEGMLFTDAYAACPVCSPTRASILSGKYPARVGVTNYIGGDAKGRVIDAPYIDHLPLSEKTLASALRDGGYTTWHVGKWHLGEEAYWPEKQGFDVNVGGCHMGCPWHGYFSPYNIPTLPNGPDGEYLPDRLGQEAAELIRDCGDTPFFLHMSFYLVHCPLQAKPEKIAKYEAKVKALGLDKRKTIEEGDFFPCEHKKKQRIQRRLLQSHPTYAAMIESLDENVGLLLDTLEETGKAENTIVVFTSDNGGLSTSEGSPTCNLPLAEGKGWMYEGGTREPLLVRWPGAIAPGSTCEVPVTSPDFYPTFLEAAGLPLLPEQHVDGVSLVPLLKGEDHLERDAIFWHYPHYGNQGGTPGCSMRSGDFKLIEFFEDGALQLYNLRDDPGEERNLAADLPEVATTLHARLVAWREEIDAIIPEPNPEFTPWRDADRA